MNRVLKRVISIMLIGLTPTILLLACAGCSQGNQGKPTLMIFTGKDSESAESMKPIIDELKKKYKDKVVFEDIDMDEPKNKELVDEYHVSMNPTFIIKNAEGEVKETFMGAAQEQMLTSAIEGVLPSEQKTPSSATDTMPLQPPAPSSSVQPIPGTPTQ